MYLRNLTAGSHMGYKLESVPGVAETLTSANFIGNHGKTYIAPVVEDYKLEIGGNLGFVDIVGVTKYGKIEGFSAPMADGDPGFALRCAGAKVAGGTYSYGGAYASGIISTSSVTFVQYDGAKKYVLFGGKPSSVKVSHKAKNPVMVEASFEGSVTVESSSAVFSQTPKIPSHMNGFGTLVLSGITAEYQTLDIDLKPELVRPEAGNAQGFVQAEIVGVSPEISVVVYPGDPSILNLWQAYIDKSELSFSWTYGTGTGNVYTWTGDVKIDTQDIQDISSIAGRKLTLVPLIKNGKCLTLIIA